MGKLILGSNSPRRKDLLKAAGFEFEVLKLDLDENPPDHIDPAKVPEMLAHQKNAHYRTQLRDEVVITADTVVILNHQVIGKPANEKEAIQILGQLSGKTHLVISGVCISSPEQMQTFSDTTEVEFEKFTDHEIDYYIKNHQPFDKAGSYGIQDWIGLTKVKSITGSYFNVMGLPINKVYQVLDHYFGISPIRH